MNYLLTGPVRSPAQLPIFAELSHIHKRSHGTWDSYMNMASQGTLESVAMVAARAIEAPSNDKTDSEMEI